MSSDIDPAKLKVVELRAELTARGLESKGNKPVLVQRLKEALEKELEKGLWSKQFLSFGSLFRKWFLEFVIIPSR